MKPQINRPVHTSVKCHACSYDMYLISVDDDLFLLRMQVADDDDVRDVGDVDAEVCCEQ